MKYVSSNQCKKQQPIIKIYPRLDLQSTNWFNALLRVYIHPPNIPKERRMFAYRGKPQASTTLIPHPLHMFQQEVHMHKHHSDVTMHSLHLERRIMMPSIWIGQKTTTQTASPQTNNPFRTRWRGSHLCAPLPAPITTSCFCVGWKSFISCVKTRQYCQVVLNRWFMIHFLNASKNLSKQQQILYLYVHFVVLFTVQNKKVCNVFSRVLCCV